MREKYTHVDGVGPNSEDLNLIAATGADASDVAIEALLRLTPSVSLATRSKNIIYRDGTVPRLSSATLIVPPFVAIVGPVMPATPGYSVLFTARTAVYDGGTIVPGSGTYLYATVTTDALVALGNRKIKSRSTGAVSLTAINATIDSVTIATGTAVPSDTAGVYHISLSHYTGSAWVTTSVAPTPYAQNQTIVDTSTNTVNYASQVTGHSTNRVLATGSLSVKTGDIVTVTGAPCFSSAFTNFPTGVWAGILTSLAVYIGDTVIGVGSGQVYLDTNAEDLHDQRTIGVTGRYTHAASDATVTWTVEYLATPTYSGGTPPADTTTTAGSIDGVCPILIRQVRP